MRRFGFALALLAGLLLAAPSFAAAKHVPVLHGTRVDLPSSTPNLLPVHGSRWIVATNAGGDTAWIDDTTGVVPARTVSVPGCGPASVGGDTLLLDCGVPGSTVDQPATVDLVTGAVERITVTTTPGYLDSSSGPAEISWRAIGARWIQGTRSSYHVGVSVFVPRAGGNVRGLDVFGPHLQPDLDVMSGGQSICPKVSLPPHDDASESTDPYFPVTPVGRWVLMPFGRPGHAVSVRSCATGLRRVLCASCTNSPVAAAGRTVAWIGSTGRLRTWRLGARGTSTYRLTGTYQQLYAFGRNRFLAVGYGATPGAKLRLRILTPPR
jgi:hypothetical protein